MDNRRPPVFIGRNMEGTLPPPDVQLDQLAQPETEQRITKKDVRKAQEILSKYKSGKSNLDQRIVEDEQWWELRHWEVLRRTARRPACNQDNMMPCGGDLERSEPTSAWLFNSIAAKHADAMDNYPEPVVLPREQSDKGSAELLSEVLPVIMENCEFEQTYSDGWWEKLKHGTAAYGIFWDTERENGLGDVAIRVIDILNLFWEPGIQDIQKSRNLFITELVDTDLLVARFPQLEGKLGSGTATIDKATYIYDDTVDTSEKSIVVDWYYKKRGLDGMTRLHYVKFVADELLYASENDPACRDTGFYEHGMYPVVMDTLYPEKGTPVGFGYVAICKDPQLYIDRLFGNILDYAVRATNPRFFMSSSTGVNEQEFLNWKKPIVRVEGQLDDTRMQQITMEPLSGIYTNIIQMKIDEMKETAANRDMMNGGTTGGVTAASAIAALQEAGNKLSRDMITASYRADSKIAWFIIELIRQFYDEQRAFRITAPNGGSDYTFAYMSNAGLVDQPIGMDGMGNVLYRKPIFDLKISAQKRSPYNQLEQNERAKEMYQLGMFNPERAQETMGALEMMNFDGIDDVRQYVQQGQTLLNLCQQLSMQVQQLSAALGITPSADGMQSAGAAPQPRDIPAVDSAESVARNAVEARKPTPMTKQGRRMAANATPHV